MFNDAFLKNKNRCIRFTIGHIIDGPLVGIWPISSPVVVPLKTNRCFTEEPVEIPEKTNDDVMSKIHADFNIIYFFHWNRLHAGWIKLRLRLFWYDLK